MRRALIAATAFALGYVSGFGAAYRDCIESPHWRDPGNDPGLPPAKSPLTYDGELADRRAPFLP